MTSTKHGHEEDYDPTKDSDYMIYFEHLGITKGLYGDKHKRHKNTHILGV